MQSTSRSFTYAEILAYLEEAENLSFEQLFDARLSAWRSMHAGQIDRESYRRESGLISLAQIAKMLASDQPDPS